MMILLLNKQLLHHKIHLQIKKNNLLLNSSSKIKIIMMEVTTILQEKVMEEIMQLEVVPLSFEKNKLYDDLIS